MDDRIDDPEWLEEAHIEDRMTRQDIAEECDCSTSTVTRRFNKFNIDSISGQRAPEDPDIDDNFLSVIDGEMLGDGTIQMMENSSGAFFKYGVKYESHRDWVISKFRDAGFKVTSSGEYEYDHGESSFWFQTRSYESLAEQRERWYDGPGAKEVPKDVTVDATSLLHWFVGDGGINQRDRNGYLHTMGFSEDGVDLLADRLSNLGIDVTKREHSRGGYQLFISKASMRDLYDVVGPVPDQISGCYDHKWPNE